MCINMYTYINVYMFVYITYIHICTYIYVYIYIDHGNSVEVKNLFVSNWSNTNQFEYV